jgi:Fe-S oxidoreductase
VTVIGGAHATHVPWEIVDQVREIDYVAIFEAEKVLAAIVSNDIEKLSEYSDNALYLMNMVGFDQADKYRGKILFSQNQTTTDLEHLFPLRKQPYIDMSNYRFADPQVGLVLTDSVETARGCPYACTFCSSRRSGLGLRSVENILEELDEISASMSDAGQRGLIQFVDDTLTFNRKRSIDLFEGMINRNYDAHYLCLTRANTIATNDGHEEDVAFAKLMKDTGFVQISLE